jgi:hypothetical protein
LLLPPFWRTSVARIAEPSGVAGWPVKSKGGLVFEIGFHGRVSAVNPVQSAGRKDKLINYRGWLAAAQPVAGARPLLELVAAMPAGLRWSRPENNYSTRNLAQTLL